MIEHSHCAKHILTGVTYTMQRSVIAIKSVSCIISFNCSCAPSDHYGMRFFILTLKVLVTRIDAQWEGMGDVG